MVSYKRRKRTNTKSLWKKLQKNVNEGGIRKQFGKQEKFGGVYRTDSVRPMSPDLKSVKFKKNSSKEDLEIQSPEPEDPLDKARSINKCGQITLMLAIIIFNIVFWLVAIQKFLRPVEEYYHDYLANRGPQE